MKRVEEPEFVRQLLETDQPVQVDAQRLTRDLVAIRRNRKTARQVRLSVAAVVSVACVAALVVALPHVLKSRADPAIANSPTPNAHGIEERIADQAPASDEASVAAASWEPGEREGFQDKLLVIKSELAGLRKKNDARRLSLLKESISRDLIEDLDFENLLTHY